MAFMLDCRLKQWPKNTMLVFLQQLTSQGKKYGCVIMWKDYQRTLPYGQLMFTIYLMKMMVME